jgi:ferric-dicitrate binding protein FerR (iron transport regulator)
MSEDKKKLKYLFSQYVGRNITPGEVDELRAIVNVADNEDLDEPLHSIWMNEEYQTDLLTKKQKERIIDNIEQSIGKEITIIPLHKRFVRTFSRIAAVLILGLLTGVSFYLYRNNQNMSIYKGNEITLNVGDGQEAGFVLPDGTSIRLNAASTLCYATNFGENNRFITFSGEAFFDVTQDKNRPFIVHTKHLNIEVVGTTFNINAYDDDDLAEITLLTGSVHVSSVKNPEYQIIIKPNEKVVCDVSTGKLTIQETNTEYETAWLNGEIVFKSETLSRVLEKLERKYAVHIRYEGSPGLLDDRFSGRISKDNLLSDVMKILMDHYPLKYEQKNNIIVLSDN